MTAALALEGNAAAQDPSGQSESGEPGSLTLWYRQPATDWTQALKVGNGRLDAVVFGGTGEERIGLNHTWLWRKWKLGGLKNPDVAHSLASRALIAPASICPGPRRIYSKRLWLPASPSCWFSPTGARSQ